MNDPFLTREWAETHQLFTGDLAAMLGSAWTTLKISLDRLHRYEFDAPWKQPVAPRRRKPRGPATA